MAERLNKRNDTETRNRIQTSQLINRLTDHVLNDAEMSQSQVRAAEILLRKRIPDLKAVDHTSDGEPVRIVLGQFIEPEGG